MKKIGYFFFTFLPLFASITLQFLVTFFVSGLLLMKFFLSNIASGNNVSYEEIMSRFTSIHTSVTISSLSSIVFAVFGIVLFGAWFALQFHGDVAPPAKSLSNPKLILGLLLLVPALQMLSTLLTAFSASLFPAWMEFYENLMESVGLSGGSPSPLILFYAVLLGPIEEELTFRGVALASAQKALPFWAANLFQALLFGVFHLNLIQGIYAFCIGLFLGYVYHRSGSIWISILLHIFFNFWGGFLSSFVSTGLFLSLSVPLGILGWYLFWKNTSKSSVNHFPNFSDM